MANTALIGDNHGMFHQVAPIGPFDGGGWMTRVGHDDDDRIDRGAGWNTFTDLPRVISAWSGLGSTGSR